MSTKPVPELSLRSLVGMGFTETQAEQIYDAVSKARGGRASKHALSTLSVLFVLGLNPSSVLKLLEKCPELYTVKETQLQQRIDNLRKLGLVEGEAIVFMQPSYCNIINALLQWKYFILRVLNFNRVPCVIFKLIFFLIYPSSGSLQRAVAHYPHILTVPVKMIKSAVMFLREKCLFTAQQVTDIIRDSPAIVLENMVQLEYKFQVSM